MQYSHEQCPAGLYSPTSTTCARGHLDRVQISQNWEIPLLTLPENNSSGFVNISYGSESVNLNNGSRSYLAIVVAIVLDTDTERVLFLLLNPRDPA
jgi:hypothetical protein